MPIEEKALDTIARAYVAPMTPIRGRRVLRLLKREFSRFEQVIPATAEDGMPALLAVADNGAAAICKTTGRGATAVILEWPRLEGAAVATSYDLLKDSLPIVCWTIWHASFAEFAGELTITAADFRPADQIRIADALRNLGRYK